VVAVVGAGPIGLAAIVGAQLFPLTAIVAIDLADSRLDAAKQFGATVAVNNGNEDPLEAVKELSDGLLFDADPSAPGRRPTARPKEVRDSPLRVRAVHGGVRRVRASGRHRGAQVVISRGPV
jgi:threonine dehydrogenase-like Zn-dependent dehydrogenase